MANAQMIIERCGGFKVVAAWLGLQRCTVQRWTYERPRGRGNVIPVKNWAALIAAAQAHGFEITLQELAVSASSATLRKAKPKSEPKQRRAA